MLLEARNLQKTFGGLTAVDDVSFRVADGEILGMVGANGSGKTTCLNMLTRLAKPNRGAMMLGGQDYTKLPPHLLLKLGIARTFQNLRLFHNLTVRENVALGAQVHADVGGERAIQKRVDELLELGSIRQFDAILPSALPYGTQRVVEIARALASAPKLLFLDEPFAGMSSEEARGICNLLLDMRRKTGMALVIVDHNVEVLVSIAERLIALAEGKVVAEGAADHVLSDPAVIRSYVGADV